jgi:DNA-binding NarL/FixJ family response regulator
MASSEQGGKGPGQLTRREKEIASLLMEGLSNKQIARMLGITPLTAKTHVQNVLDKLGMNSRTKCAIKLLKEQG